MKQWRCRGGRWVEKAAEMSQTSERIRFIQKKLMDLTGSGTLLSMMQAPSAIDPSTLDLDVMFMIMNYHSDTLHER